MTSPPRKNDTPVEVLIAQYSGACAVVFCIASLCWGLLPHTGYHFSALVFLTAIVLIGTVWHRGPVILMAVLCALVWNFIFIPPQFTFRIDKPHDAVLFALFFVVALTLGHLTTQLRKREAALERHHREREALLAEKHRADLLAESERLHRTLLDGVSHELKTPLAVIRTALDGLDSNNPFAGEIKTATRRLERIVNGFLEMTRVESEALTPKPDWCEIGDVLHAATAALEHELRDHPLQITGADKLPLLRLDSRLLAQALGNVLHNAAAYSPAGTPVEIHVSLVENNLELTVRDHGMGLTDADVAHVFDKFYRSSGSPAGGTGLGLAISRGLLRAMKGDIAAGNHPGGGALFALHLPVQIRQSSP